MILNDRDRVYITLSIGSGSLAQSAVGFADTGMSDSRGSVRFCPVLTLVVLSLETTYKLGRYIYIYI